MAENLKILGTVYPNVAGIIVAGYEDYNDYLRIFDKDYRNVPALIATNTNLEDRTYVDYQGGGRTADDVTVSGATVSIPAGFYETAVTKSVASGTAGTPVATKGSVLNHAVTVTPSVANTAGYISGGTKTGTGVRVTAAELVSGTRSITTNGATVDVTNYANVNVQIPSDIRNQNKTVNPSINIQQINADSGYSGLGTVTVNAMSAYDGTVV